MEDSLTKSNKANEYVDVALRNYKYHNVPIVTVIELQFSSSNIRVLMLSVS